VSATAALSDTVEWLKDGGGDVAVSFYSVAAIL